MDVPSPSAAWHQSLGSPHCAHYDETTGLVKDMSHCQHAVPGNNMPGWSGRWSQRTDCLHSGITNAPWSHAIHPLGSGVASWTQMCRWSQMPTSPFPWRQEVPASMPWASENQGVVNFTGSVILSPSHNPDRGPKCKRRIEKQDDEPSSKHFVSEEMMAARFNSLSLNNDHMYSSNGLPVRGLRGDKTRWQAWAQDYSRFQELEGRLRLDEEDEDGETELKKSVIVEGVFDMNDSPVFTVSSALQEELKFVASNILPERLLQSMSLPCMELVLWKPPGSIIQQAIRSLTGQQDTFQSLSAAAKPPRGSRPDQGGQQTRTAGVTSDFLRDCAGVGQPGSFQSAEDEMEL
ncbi:uncharacterized protein LOC102357370 [Latimeria chalumnae]|uniref:uncharacterized protein LOC102357370 n=1 Tax=Latimeria chalumnae TaxID=7897 RepID=UPI0003C1099C|nr:PREDICTED: uncharacterized protein LOC102357370 isoform X2 [Latimeria chalumnae]|eukprot:XP_006000937.1 PREDICTED: uncharacterized protein LOC102357370 isoform X2 [Latimeria chalumnae]